MAGGEQAGQQGGFLGPSPGGAGSGGAGVTSFNGQTGAVKGTLASIYAFGLSDDPLNDNRFTNGPGGWDVLFPLSDVNANEYMTGAFETTLNSQSNTQVNFWRRKGDHTINTEKVFSSLSINDPTWNESGDTLNPVQTWAAEMVYYGADLDATRVFDAGQAWLGGRKWSWQDGGTLVYDGTPARGWTLGTGRNLSRDQYGWDHIFGSTQQTQRQSGYGYVVNQLQVDTHGMALSHLEQVRYGTLSSGGILPGDGMMYAFAVGNLFDLNGTHLKVGYAAGATDSAEGNADNSEWYASIWASLGAPADVAVMTEAVRFYASVGQKLLVGGMQLPDGGAHGTATVSDAGTAKFLYDNAAGHVYVSINAGPYTLLI